MSDDDIYDMQFPAGLMSIHSPEYGVPLNEDSPQYRKIEIAVDLANRPDYCGYIQVSLKNGELTYTPITNKEFYKNE